MRIETDRLSKRFDGVVALDNVSLDFRQGEVAAVIGPNSAGKTTLFSVISGFLKPDSGDVFLVEDEKGYSGGNGNSSIHKKSILGVPPNDISLKGVGVLFQDVRLFNRLSVLENVALGIKRQAGENPIRSLFTPAAVRRVEKETIEKAIHYIDFVGLKGKARQWGEQLSYGQQKLAAIARLLAGDSKIFLFDEPTSGVHPAMIDVLLGLIQNLAAKENLTVVMIEHNLNLVKRIGDRVHLMSHGRVEMSGSPDDVLRDSTVKEFFPTI